MPTSLSLDDHLAAVEASGIALAEHAVAAGHDAHVPTCPAWTALALVAHQAAVHRWAAANVLRQDESTAPTQTELRERFAADLDGLLVYYREGHGELLDALRGAEPDLRALRFLNDAPAPREFWARRQAHETTIHMVDALAASLGRLPRADEVGIETSLAADGIDELVRGFLTRGDARIYTGREYSIAIVPHDAPRRWVLRVAEQLTVDAGDPPVDDGGDGDVVVSGSAAQLYLAVWNRGDEIDVDGHDDLLDGWLDHWRAKHRVRWG